MIIFVSRLDKVEFFWLFLLRWNIHPAEASQHEQILLGNHRIVTEAREDAATNMCKSPLLHQQTI